MDRDEQKWEDFVADETLFGNSIRLRHLVWTIQRHTQPGARLLEVGFGSGKTAVLLADMGYCVTAIDINDVLVGRMHEQYGKLYPKGRLSFRKADMFSLPWKNEAFEIVYHQGVLEHFQDSSIVRALKEQARIAPLVIFDVPNSRCRVRPFGDERLLPAGHWRHLIGEAGLGIIDELGRGPRPWHYLLPMALLSKRGTSRLSWLSRSLGTVSIFVCKSPRGDNSPGPHVVTTSSTFRAAGRKW
jgi:SAM-dependent methyltransferase